MNCERIDLLLGWVEGELDESERVAVEAHLQGCAACTETAEAMRATGDAVGELPLPAPSAEARDKAYAAVMDLMAQEAPAEAPVAPRRGIVIRFVQVAAAAACLLLTASFLFGPSSEAPGLASGPETMTKAADEAAERAPAADPAPSAMSSEPPPPAAPPPTQEAAAEAGDAAPEAELQILESEQEELARDVAKEPQVREERELLREERELRRQELEESLKRQLERRKASLAKKKEAVLGRGAPAPAPGAKGDLALGAGPADGSPADAAADDLAEDSVADGVSEGMADAPMDKAGASSAEAPADAFDAEGDAAADEAVPPAPKPELAKGLPKAAEKAKTRGFGGARVAAAWRLDSPNGRRVYLLLADSRVVYQDEAPDQGRVTGKDADAPEVWQVGGPVRVAPVQAPSVRDDAVLADGVRGFRVAEELLAILVRETDSGERARARKAGPAPAARPVAGVAPDVRLARTRALLTALGERVDPSDSLARLQARVRVLQLEHQRSLLKLRRAPADLEAEGPTGR
jgi:anti-sigma factor RsiW